MAVGSFFFSAAPPAQNSPELHFHFINYFIQHSLVGSLTKEEFFVRKNAEGQGRPREGIYLPFSPFALFASLLDQKRSHED